jgi:L-Ala-D/L-Glu epimerase
MRLRFQAFTVHKRFALTISRGTTASSTNLWVTIEHDGTEGWGEASPFSIGDVAQPMEQTAHALESLVLALKSYSPWERQAIEAVLDKYQIPSAARAAIDIALHDWQGKRLSTPLWKLWGLDRDRIPMLSVTIGIGTPLQAQQRLQAWLEHVPAKMIKVKLGNPAGILADQAMFESLRMMVPPDCRFCVDANGGWGLGKAMEMCQWLADRNVEYVEQPLVRGRETDLFTLKQVSPLPIFADESCWSSCDIPRLASFVDGINIKLMKAGGLTEAMRMIQTARAYGLRVMLGCYSDSALLNSAAAQLGPLVDYLDLDSHLNLLDDPFAGASLEGARLVPNDLPGLGVIRR